MAEIKAGTVGTAHVRASGSRRKRVVRGHTGWYLITGDYVPTPLHDEDVSEFIEDPKTLTQDAVNTIVESVVSAMDRPNDVMREHLRDLLDPYVRKAR